MTESAPKPPTARQDRHQTIHHDITLSDDYGWLREKDSPEVTAFLNAENAYAEALTADLAALREQLYNEMLSHIKQTDESVPYREGNWWYYVRTEEGKQYAILCRKRGSVAVPEGTEEIILDGNQLAEGLPFFAIGATDISDDGRWLAYRWTRLASANTRSGSRISKRVKPCLTKSSAVGSVTWAADNVTPFLLRRR